MFPSDNLDFREIENRPGFEYDEDKKSYFFAEDFQILADNITAIENVFQFRDGTMINGRIYPTVSGNNLTLAIKTLSGDNPSVDDPVIFYINGVRRVLTTTLSVTLVAGYDWFSRGALRFQNLEQDYFAYVGYNATDGLTIGVAILPNATKYGDFSTTYNYTPYCKISTITHANSSDKYCVIGRFSATLSNTFNWTIGSDVINHPIFESKVRAYVAQSPSGAQISGIDTALYQIRYNCIKMWVSLYNRTIGAGSTLYILLPSNSSAISLVSINYALRVGTTWQGSNVYSDLSSGIVQVFKDYARTAWAGTETGIYLMLDCEYPI